MDMGTVALLAGAGVLGGAMNAVAGGGTLITFPALMAAGLDPLTANVTNAVAIWPGHAAAVPAQWRDLGPVRALGPRMAAFGLGGLAGAVLLLAGGERAFTPLVPWLILIATLIFASGPLLRRWAGRAGLPPAGAFAVEAAFGAYGGYFGAGLGVLVLAALTLTGVADLRQANAQKNLLATLVTTISVLLFSVAGAVAWAPALVMLGGAVAGGWLGGRFARRLPQGPLRVGIVAVGLALAGVYFLG